MGFRGEQGHALSRERFPRPQDGRTRTTVLSICNSKQRPLLSLTKEEFEALVKIVPEIKKQMEDFQRKIE